MERVLDIEDVEVEGILERIRDMGATVMSFSSRVAAVPLETDFQEMMKIHGLGFQDRFREWPNVSPRIIELFGGNSLSLAERQGLATGVLDVALRHGRLRGNGILFIDHSDDPEGIILGDRF
ncbi:MAG TPA: hypothetical protein VEH48_01195 [Candidatus Nitrosopolaris sp.]|nr:hypothetical protein [Candidatus Nitrosopolaris sp.]